MLMASLVPCRYVGKKLTAAAACGIAARVEALEETITLADLLIVPLLLTLLWLVGRLEETRRVGLIVSSSAVASCMVAAMLFDVELYARRSCRSSVAGCCADGAMNVWLDWINMFKRLLRVALYVMEEED